MELTFLGTGTSQGVPLIAHPESGGCDLNDSRNWRTRTSAHLKIAGISLQIDAAPEFRLQCIQNKISAIDHFFLTHGHADHIMGMDDLRRFIDLRGGAALPVYSTEEGLNRVKTIYPYAIRSRPEFKGYPAFSLYPMPEALELPGCRVDRVDLPHGRIDVMGLVFTEISTGKRLAYYTDCKHLPPRAVDLAMAADLVVLDALRPMTHPTHMSVHEAVETARQLGARQTWFTHMTYLIDHEKDSRDLPDGMAFAYDGLSVCV